MQMNLQILQYKREWPSVSKFESDLAYTIISTYE